MSGSYRVIAPDRYLRVVPVPDRVVLAHATGVVFESPCALQLFEGDRDPVWYLPLTHVPDGLLHRNGKHYQCRWKGEAVCFDVRLRDEQLDDMAWCYHEGPEDVALLRDHVAFDASAFGVSRAV